MQPTHDPAPPSGKRPFWRNPWLWGVVMLIALDSLFRFTPLLRRIPEPPPVHATLPDFALVDSAGAPFARADLAGHVHLTGLIATTHPDTAALIADLLELQSYMVEQEPYERHAEGLRLLLITVDPADGPEALAGLATDRGLDPARWTLLGGDAAELDRVTRILAGAHEIATEERVDPSALQTTGRIAIVDGAGGIRGFYDASTEEGRDEAYWRGLRTIKDQRMAADTAGSQPGSVAP